MYKGEIAKLIKAIDSELNVGFDEMEEDLRVLGMDSIAFIRFLALIEDTYNIEFEYGFMDKYEEISIGVLNKIIMENLV